MATEISNSVAPNCLGENAHAFGNLTYVGEGKSLTLEANGWNSHDVSTYMAALLLHEVLGFDVTVSSLDMLWETDNDNPLTRLASGEIDANLEAWDIDYPIDLMELYVDKEEKVERSTHKFQGRVGAYVPRYVIEDNPSYFPDYWRAYTKSEVLDLFRWNDTFALDEMRSKWTKNCDAKSFGCVGGEWRPPRCGPMDQPTFCIPFFHVYPGYAVGWIEQLIQNLELNITVYYAGPDINELAYELEKDRRPLMFFSWYPHELVARNEYVRVTFPDVNPACIARDTSDRFGGRDCDNEGTPLYKLTTKSLASRSKAAHEFIHKRYSLSLEDQYTMLGQLKTVAHNGLTMDESICAWARNNTDVWGPWVKGVATDDLPPCSEISYNQIEQFPVSQMQEIRERCFKEASSDDDQLIPILAGGLSALVLLAALLAYIYVERRKKHGDSVWAVKTSEIKFDDPPKIAGRGTFGLVLIGEYRGTQVAVKRVIPPKAGSGKNDKCNTFLSIMNGSGSEQNSSTPEMALPVSKDLESGCHGSTNLTNSTNMTASRSVVKYGSGSASMSQNRKPRQKDEYARLKKDFIVEMRHLSKLRHPCITTVMGAVIEKGEEPLLIMEYMDHGSLYDILHNETIPIDGHILLPILRDIAQGVRFLHAADPCVIHGDLKAANILVDRNFRAKVADFGLSAKKTIGATGTPLWMAPELLRGESSNTAASDVYSFGIVLYEVYSRQDPYQGEDSAQVIKDIVDPKVNKRPSVPPACPSHAETLMKDCLKSDPSSRPSFEEIELRMKRMDADNVEPGISNLSMHAKKKIYATRSEDLLFQIFPRHIAEALRDGRKVEPENREMVTIFFSDIVGFTDISSKLPPIKVQEMLDRLYSVFDDLSHKHDVFKIETIGDAYVCVTNLVHDQSEDHVKRIAEFAVDAVQGANETPVDLENPSMGTIQIRVGFHSGPVIASVVGTRLPKYSMFGDTINTASRMESNSQAGRIQCSERSATLLKQQYPQMPMLARGEIPIKGKGTMKTFWVNEGDVGPSPGNRLPTIPETNKTKGVMTRSYPMFEENSGDLH